MRIGSGSLTPSRALYKSTGRSSCGWLAGHRTIFPGDQLRKRNGGEKRFIYIGNNVARTESGRRRDFRISDGARQGKGTCKQDADEDNHLGERRHFAVR